MVTESVLQNVGFNVAIQIRFAVRQIDVKIKSGVPWPRIVLAIYFHKPAVANCVIKPIRYTECWERARPPNGINLPFLLRCNDHNESDFGLDHSTRNVSYRLLFDSLLISHGSPGKRNVSLTNVTINFQQNVCDVFTARILVLTVHSDDI